MIGKIVQTMLVAAAKINISSIVPAFDQTRVPRIIHVPSGAANMSLLPLPHIVCFYLFLVCYVMLSSSAQLHER